MPAARVNAKGKSAPTSKTAKSSTSPSPRKSRMAVPRIALSYQEAGDTVGLCERSIRRLVKNGTLNAVKLGGAAHLRC